MESQFAICLFAFVATVMGVAWCWWSLRRRHAAELAATRKRHGKRQQMAAALLNEARDQIARLRKDLAEAKSREKRVIARYVKPLEPRHNAARCIIVMDDAFDLDIERPSDTFPAGTANAVVFAETLP